MSEHTAENDAGKQWTEYGVRRTWGLDVGSVAFFGYDRRTAEKCARDWPGVFVQRTVTAGDWTRVIPPGENA